MADDPRHSEVGRAYRFFLGWRHASFAGNVVVVGGVLSLTISAFEKAREIAWMVPLLATPIGVVLWIIDVRTRALYHASIRAGEDLEGEGGGFFTRLDKDVLIPKGVSHWGARNHSLALDIFFLGSSILMFAFAVILFVGYR